MKIKICGVFRDQDIDYINEARPDFAGFVFARSKREISFAQASRFRKRLADGIAAVGVFVNSPIEDIIALYRNGVISLAQLHGNEDDTYIVQLREKSTKSGRTLPVIKVIKSAELERISENHAARETISLNIDYYLVDSGAGTGKTFNWNILETGASWLQSSGKPWFFAGGINADNIAEAMTFKPFCIDISGGAETNGVKDREKIVQLTEMARKGNTI